MAPLYHPGRGGLGRQAVLLTEALAARGVRPLVITRSMEGLPAYEFALDVERVAVRAGRESTHNYEQPNLGNLVTSLRFSAGLARVLEARRADYDLVHFHGASLPLLLALPHALLRGKRVVAKVAALHQGVEAGDLRGHWGPLGRVMARELRGVHAFVATTAEIGQALRDEGYAPERIARIPNFVEITRFRPPSEAERARLRADLGFEGRTVVLHSGRLTERKGAPVLLEAFAAARGSARPDPALLVFLGDGPERAALQARAAALGLGDAVRFLGFREDVARWLRAADVFALSSRVEGMPNALLEAMAVGLPAVATRIGGSLEALGEGPTLGDGQAGLLVPPDDAPALGRELGRLLGDPALRARVGGAAARRISERFALEAVVPRYLDLYRRLLAS